MNQKHNHHLICLFILTLSSGPPIANACSCVLQLPPESLIQYDVAFVGTAVARAPVEDGDQWSHAVMYDFVVADVWKGVVKDTIRVRASSMSTACGINFYVGRQYLVFASQHDGFVSTWACSGTRSYAGWDWATIGMPDPLWSRRSGAWRSRSLEDLAGDIPNRYAFQALAALESERDRVIALFQRILREGPPNSVAVMMEVSDHPRDWRQLDPDIVRLLQEGEKNEPDAALITLLEVMPSDEFCPILIDAAQRRATYEDWKELLGQFAQHGKKSIRPAAAQSLQCLEQVSGKQSN